MVPFMIMLMITVPYKGNPLVKYPSKYVVIFIGSTLFFLQLQISVWPYLLSVLFGMLLCLLMIIVDFLEMKTVSKISMALISLTFAETYASILIIVLLDMLFFLSFYFSIKITIMIFCVFAVVD